MTSGEGPSVANICPLCGERNNCKQADPTTPPKPCWCELLSVPPALLAQIPAEQRQKACICQKCITKFAAQENAAKETLAASDFYIDSTGLTVFTAEYLRKRGYCCDNNCRHCPYK